MVCNSGTSLVPTVDAKMHHFNNVGLYDALFVMQDAETKTLWNHITGEAVYGPLLGRSLGPIANLLQMNVKQALVMDPNLAVAMSSRPFFAAAQRMAPGNPDAALSSRFNRNARYGRYKASSNGHGPRCVEWGYPAVLPDGTDSAAWRGLHGRHR